MYVYIWRCEHAMCGVEILMYQILLSFMSVCIQMMPVILYLLISSLDETSC